MSIQKISYTLKHSLNKCVLSCRLKVEIFGQCLKLYGKSFNKEGAQFLKARLPWAFFHLCCTRIFESLEDRRVRAGLYRSSRLLKYDGADWLVTHLNTRTRILYFMRHSTGNQWRDWSTGVICSLLPVLVTRRAAWFWATWSRCRRVDSSLYRRELL